MAAGGFQQPLAALVCCGPAATAPQPQSAGTDGEVELAACLAPPARPVVRVLAWVAHGWSGAGQGSLSAAASVLGLRFARLRLLKLDSLCPVKGV